MKSVFRLLLMMGLLIFMAACSGGQAPAPAPVSPLNRSPAPATRRRRFISQGLDRALRHDIGDGLTLHLDL